MHESCTNLTRTYTESESPKAQKGKNMKQSTQNKIRALLENHCYIEKRDCLNIDSMEICQEYHIINRINEVIAVIDSQVFHELETSGIITPYVTEYQRTVYGLRL